MSDKEIIKIFFINDNHYNTNFVRIDWLKNHNEIYEYLLNRYPDSESTSKTLWRIKLGIEIRPTCKTCGKPVKYIANGLYRDHCSKSCSKKDISVNEKYENTCIEKYGESSYSKIKELKKWI